MRVKFRVIGAVFACLVLVATTTLANEETLNGADSNQISVLDPRKLTRASPNINAAAINSLTGSPSSPSADGKSNETTLIFATHVTEPAPQLENQPELNNQLGQNVYLQAQPPQHNQHQPQAQHPQQQHHHHQHPAGQFLYPQPAPVQSSSLGSPGAPLNAPGASPPYLYNPGYGVQYVQYVPRPVVMPNYPPPPSAYGPHPHSSPFANLPHLLSTAPHHSHHYPSHNSGISQSAQFILPPPPGHHTIPSTNSQYSPSSLHSAPHHSQPSQNQHQQQTAPQQHQHHHHPQTHFLAGPPPQSQPVAQPTSTYVSGSAVSQHQAQSQQQQHQQQQQQQQAYTPQSQLHSHQGQATSQPSSYLTYSSPSHHYHMSQPQVHPHLSHQSPNPTAQSSNIIPSHVQPPQHQHQFQQQQQVVLQAQGPQQPLIGSYSQQAPLYSYVQPQQQGPRYGAPSDSFLNTNEYLPHQVQYDNSQFRAIKRNSKA